MTIDDAILMAFADGELDLLARKRVEQALAADPPLAERAAAFGALTEQVRDAFAPIAQEPVPDDLKAMLTTNVVPIVPRRAPRLWLTGLAVAASLLLGVGLGAGGRTAGQASFAVRDGRMVAAGPLARALDTQLASAGGDTRVLVSFRAREGYCRVFASAVVAGIACRNGADWDIRRARSASPETAADYRQAASSDAALMAEAQDMMVGAPLDVAGETRARALNWTLAGATPR